MITIFVVDDIGIALIIVVFPAVVYTVGRCGVIRIYCIIILVPW